MRFPGLPRLPVSRRRHEEYCEYYSDRPTRASKRWWREHAEVLWANSVQFMRERDESRARVAELEQAIREHRRRTRDDGWQTDTDLNLYVVLDGHVVQHPVRRESCCYVCGSPAWLTGQLIYLGGEQHWRHAECQPPKAADVRGHDRQEPQECICWASSYCPLHEHRDTPRGGRR